MKIGSVCSGIEAASVAWKKFDSDFLWFSEIAPFQSKFLKEVYPKIPNIGDLNKIPDLIREGTAKCPDLICGGTPCQAFSVTGHQKGLEDERGQLTLKFIEIIEANDEMKKGNPTIVFWENVEGVLKDKTNAFGCFISGLAGCSDVLPVDKWPNAGLVRGPTRNVAWRVLDAKFFGVPQQRRRLYVLAGGKEFHPEDILFEKHGKMPLGNFVSAPLIFEKSGKHFEVFRGYSDCVYSAYATKWNGNAAAYNGSLYVCENDRLRRMSPLETERLMGFPDNYTDVSFAKRSSRYHGVGNSWAVPVVRWIGQRIFKQTEVETLHLDVNDFNLFKYAQHIQDADVFLFSDDIVPSCNLSVNVSCTPETIIPCNIADIIDTDVDEDIFISPVGCKGILRRAEERGMNMNPRLKKIMEKISGQMTEEEIEKISRIQPRGDYSLAIEKGELDIPTRKTRGRKAKKSSGPIQMEFWG